MLKENVNPVNYNLLVEVLKFPTIKNGVFVGDQALLTKTNIEFYYGKVLKLGSKAKDDSQCPELEEGVGVIFSQIAGVPPETEDAYCKVIRGYDVVAVIKEFTDLENMEVEKQIYPTKDRILVKIIDEDIMRDGIYNDSKADPREAITQKGIVLKCADGADQYEEGTIVFFDPYCGNLIVNEIDLKLKTVNSFDILYTINN
jgi:co-chaperonin GroES (HSP10)